LDIGSASHKTVILLALQPEHVSIKAIQGVPVGKFIILGGHVNGHSKQSVYLHSFRDRMTASVAWWSEFLATDPEARFRFPALPEKK
jgi:hypothetical protein